MLGQAQPPTPDCTYEMPFGTNSYTYALDCNNHINAGTIDTGYVSWKLWDAATYPNKSIAAEIIDFTTDSPTIDLSYTS